VEEGGRGSFEGIIPAFALGIHVYYMLHMYVNEFHEADILRN